MNERGDEITIPRTEVAKAKVFIGARAVENGYADQIGALEAAISAAATEAGISEYSVSYRNPYDFSAGTIFLENGSNSDNSTITYSGTSPFEFEGVETVQFLMLYGIPQNQEVIMHADE